MLRTLYPVVVLQMRTCAWMTPFLYSACPDGNRVTGKVSKGFHRNFKFSCIYTFVVFLQTVEYILHTDTPSIAVLSQTGMYLISYIAELIAIVRLRDGTSLAAKIFNEIMAFEERHNGKKIFEFEIIPFRF